MQSSDARITTHSSVAATSGETRCMNFSDFQTHSAVPDYGGAGP